MHKTKSRKSGRTWWWPTTVRPWIVILAWSVFSLPAIATEISGSARVTAISTDNRGTESQGLEQSYSFNLFQQWTPYLSLRFGYTDFLYDTAVEQGTEFNRRSRSPSLDLLYSRERVTARLSALSRSRDSSAPSGNFELRSVNGFLAWEVTRGFGFRLDFLDETNTDPDLFGRDATTRLFAFETYYRQKSWGLFYRFRRNTLDNETSEVFSTQDRHEVGGQATRVFFNSKLRIGLSANLTEARRDTESPQGIEGAERVPAVQGLFTIDTSPAAGRLAPAPALIDGDLLTPADPGIDIGAANTFRNIGLDLGLTRPVTRLQIWVDNTSGANVVWRVYTSRDNLVWEVLNGVTSEFDPALLRYTLRFPETTDRFFKAVNLTVNPSPEVLVTEIEAQLDFVTDSSTSELDSSLYRVAAIASYRPIRRLPAQVDASWTNDKDLAAGFVQQDFEFARVGVGIDLEVTPNLKLATGYSLADTADRRETPLLRTLETFTFNVNWTPLPTLEALLTAQSREELEVDELLQADRSVRMDVFADLWREYVALRSAVGYSQLDDPFSGQTRDSWNWSQSLILSPTQYWRLEGFYGETRNESFEGEPQFDQSNYGVSTAWYPTGFISLNASWARNEINTVETTTQRAGINYTPGPKLQMSYSLQDTSSEERLTTRTDSARITYKLTTFFRIFGSLSRSGSELFGAEPQEITTARIGVRLSF